MDGSDPVTAVAVEPTTRAPAPDRRAALLGWLLVGLAGLHLSLLAASLPTMVGRSALGLDWSAATLALTATLLGSVVAAAVVGSWARHRTLLVLSVLLSSSSLLLAPLATDPGLFTLLRTLGGLAVGAALPAAARLLRRGSAGLGVVVKASAAYHLGGVVATVLAMLTLPDWARGFVVAGVLSLLLLPLAAAWGSRTPPRPAPPAERAVRVLVSWRHRWVVVAGLVASFTALAVMHGVGAWLPALLRIGGADRSTSLGLLLCLNLAGALGALATGMVQHRLRRRTAVLLWLAGAALVLSLLSTAGADLPGTVVLVALAGALLASTQPLIHRFVRDVVPPQSRPAMTPLLAALGRAGAVVGVLVVGVLVSHGLGDPWAFQLLAALVLVGLVAVVWMTPRTVDGAPESMDDVRVRIPARRGAGQKVTIR